MRSNTWGLLTTACVFLFVSGVVFAEEPKGVEENDNVAIQGDSVSGDPEAGVIDVGRMVPLSPTAVFRPFVTGVGEADGSAAAAFTGTPVYSNRLGGSVYVPGSTPGLLVADDIATTVTPGCILDGFRFRVSGDPVGDGTGVGPFSVTYALYAGCPSVGGLPLFTPVVAEFEDNGDYEVTFKPDPATEIVIPFHFYLGVSFNRFLAGIRAGAPPTLGFSADRFDFPLTNCDASFGAFPAFDHGSFDLEIFARNDCPGGACLQTCVGGDNSGEFCARDDCIGGTCTPNISCVIGADHGNDCSDDSECVNVCIGGPSNGNNCDTQADCPSECAGGDDDGNTCTSNDDCSGVGFCSGFCLVSTCSGSECVAGISAGSPCFADDCPGGSCNGPRGCDGGDNADQVCLFDCPPGYPAYKNTAQGGTLYTPSPTSEWFAEDILLENDVSAQNPCEMVSFEVGFRGGISGFGAVQASLHTFLGVDDPSTESINEAETAGIIAGTTVSATVAGALTNILRQTFDPPILLTQANLSVVFRIQNSFVGAIRTCQEAGPGTTENLFFVLTNQGWTVTSFPDASCHAGFEVAINCAGSPPSGACCDMQLTEDRICIGGPLDGSPCSRHSQCRVCIGGARDGFSCDQDIDCPDGECPGERDSFCVGDAVCRELPQVNCAFSPLWREGEVCGTKCEGGFLDGEQCDNPLGCPAACEGGLADGDECSADADCPGECVGSGILLGFPCFEDANCTVLDDPLTCDDVGSCGDEGSCVGAFCFGGDNHGIVCTRHVDCPGGACGSACNGGDNDGLPCLIGFDCPGGICPAGVFPEECGRGSCCTTNDRRCCVTEKECHTAGTLCEGEPLETPIQFDPVLLCATGGCPRGACIAREGECTEARDGLCIGGPLNGTACDPEMPCVPDLNDCCWQGQDAKPPAFCQGTPGCEDPFCCTAVCADGDFLSCCSQHWSQACATHSFEKEECQRTPANNACFSPLALKGAEFLQVPGSVEADLINAGTDQSDPGMCCDDINPGAQADAGVWYRVDGPANGHLLVHTCNTTGGGGDDSLVQVFAVGEFETDAFGNDLDGICEDLSFCNIFLDDCFDDSQCVLNEERACEQLAPIACSDDAVDEGFFCENAGGTPFPFNSRVCVDVIPFRPYYIHLGAKSFHDENLNPRDKYRITVADTCTPAATLANDLCTDATVLPLDEKTPDFCNVTGPANCDVPFDLSGAGSMPASFDCPGPSEFCLVTMENDVWYDWTAPATGRLAVDTCDGLSTPDTSLAIYDGCGCPVDSVNELACSETEVTQDCFLGSRTAVAVQGGQCYKIRLGGNLGDTPSGTLHTVFTSCSDGAVTLVDPPEGTVDARQPHPPGDPDTPQGIKEITVQWVGGTTDVFCRSYCETDVDGSAANSVFIMEDLGGDMFKLHLAREIAPGAVATVVFFHSDGTTTSLTVTSHPGNVDGTGPSDAADISALVDALNGQIAFDPYAHDIDHSGTLTGRDALRLIDLHNGAGGAFDVWGNTGFPDCFPCCAPD